MALGVGVMRGSTICQQTGHGSRSLTVFRIWMMFFGSSTRLITTCSPIRNRWPRHTSLTYSRLTCNGVWSSMQPPSGMVDQHSPRGRGAGYTLAPHPPVRPKGGARVLWRHRPTATGCRVNRLPGKMASEEILRPFFFVFNVFEADHGQGNRYEQRTYDA